MESKSKLVPIALCRSDDWTTNLYRLRIMREWCAKNNVPALELGGMPDEYPHTVLVPEEDAIAFRLKFGRW